ncbi:undecaprenol kinase [Sediminitomix flava]|uniref:Undecaprenol kinase n=2 Tax=Sediminitomix flava TaxID=379075 RepID=A0A315ZAD3_SEDFL|nr:undecaprenol kinase [Sediminitomix flava]
MPLYFFHFYYMGQFSVKDRIMSFKYAFKGIYFLLKEEHNARIHLVASLFVVILGFYFRIKAAEWQWLIFSISFVFVVEALNTCIENLADFIHLDQHPQIGKIKDIAAAAVLISAIGAALIGLIIFIPYLYDLPS